MNISDFITIIIKFIKLLRLLSMSNRGPSTSNNSITYYQLVLLLSKHLVVMDSYIFSNFLKNSSYKLSMTIIFLSISRLSTNLYSILITISHISLKKLTTLLQKKVVKFQDDNIKSTLSLNHSTLILFLQVVFYCSFNLF